MVRDDLYITVPSFFRCPISLDVMKSPVSLSTGVTYDRASIQRWLDSGNNTCPATMQVLQTKEFVPNRTLQRLIQIWSDSIHHHRPESPDESIHPVLSQDQVKDIVKVTDIKKEDFLSNLSMIVSFAKESDENKTFLAKLDGFVSMLVEILSNVKDVNILERVIRVLDLMLNKIDDQQQLTNLMLKSCDQDCLNSLLLVLQKQESLDARIDSLKILEFIAIDAESKLKIAEKEGLLSEILKSVSWGSDRRLIDAGLSCLIAISMPKRVKLKLINQKIITEMKKLITDPNSTVSVSEKALKVLEMLCSTKQGRSEICCDSGLAQAIVQKMLKVSGAATEHAVTILWSLCYLFRDQRAQEAVTSGNGLTKILLLMQSNCSPAVRQMSADLLKIFRVNYKSCLSSYDTKTTHIMPF
ncbi:hypothetical protein ACOSP7_022258 [Xanthoceras sorbifolium]